MTESDRALVERVQARDTAAFEALYARYRARVARHLVRIVRDRAAADDLAQDVFLRVWTHAERWEGRGAPAAWLLRIATNVALNHLRSVRRRRQRPLKIATVSADPEDDSLVPAWMIDTAALGPDAVLEQAEQYERLWRLVDHLSEEKREVLRLIHEEEMDIAGAADELGISEGTVKSRLHFARKRLAREWEETERREQ